VEWFQRQLFGRKSEKRLHGPAPEQLPLAGMLATPAASVDQPLTGPQYIVAMISS